LTRRIAICGTILLAAVLLTPFAFCQNSGGQTDPLFKVNVNLVVVDAQVLNKKTHQAIPSLQPGDFLLYENGVQQRISLLSQDRIPLSVVFLFDLTDSVRPVLESLDEGALQALQHLKPEDEAAVMVYAASVQVLQGFTTDHLLIAEAIRKAGKMESAEAAFFNEAIFQAATLAGKAPNNRRRVIVWLTDNVPNIPSEQIRSKYGRSISEYSLHNQTEAIYRLLKTGTSVFTLLERSTISDIESMRNFSDPRQRLYRLRFPPGDVYNYTQQTGGQVLETYGRGKVSAKMAQLIDQIRTRYAVGYHPITDGESVRFRAIRLEIAPEVQRREGKMIVETRKGYYR
jgi:VWFA-related protein